MVVVSKVEKINHGDHKESSWLKELDFGKKPTRLSVY